MINEGITIFMQYEQLESKLNALKGLSNITFGFSENSQMRAFILNELCSKDKKEFMKGLNFIVQNFQKQCQSIGKSFINIINFYLYAEKR